MDKATSTPAAVARAKAARLSKFKGPDHPSTREAWRDARAEWFAERAQAAAAKGLPFTADQVARIAVILAAGQRQEVAS